MRMKTQTFEQTGKNTSFKSNIDDQNNMDHQRILINENVLSDEFTSKDGQEL